MQTVTLTNPPSPDTRDTVNHKVSHLVIYHCLLSIKHTPFPIIINTRDVMSTIWDNKVKYVILAYSDPVKQLPSLWTPDSQGKMDRNKTLLIEQRTDVCLLICTLVY